MLSWSLVLQCDTGHLQFVILLTAIMGRMVHISRMPDHCPLFGQRQNMVGRRSRKRQCSTGSRCSRSVGKGYCVSAWIPSSKQTWCMSLPHVLSTVVCLVALAWPALGAASYLIELRNGRHVVASRYWQEDHSIRFETEGGVASVAK